jgi:hypothetical protein
MFDDRKDRKLAIAPTQNLPMRFLVLTSLLATLCLSTLTQAAAGTLPTVHFIGTAYAGQFASISQRFPYVTEIDGFGSKSQAVDAITSKATTMLAGDQPMHYALTTGQISNLQAKDQAIDLALLINRETVLQTSYNANGQMVYKVLAQVRAQALYFDVVQSAIVRDIPLSFAYISTFDHQPSRDEIKQCVQLALYGADGHSGLVKGFVSTVVSSPYPTTGTKFFRVNSPVVIDNKAIQALALDAPDAHSQVQDLQNSIADTFAETFSAAQGVSFIPYAADYLVGNRIPLSLSNGDAFSLKLPTADYVVGLQLLGAKKILFGQSVAGKSLIYGTLFKIQLIEPISGRHYLDAEFKNGVVVKVPATQTSDTQDDRIAYDDSIRELFENLSQAISTGPTDWTSKATSSPDINAQLQATKELFQSCK